MKDGGTERVDFHLRAKGDQAKHCEESNVHVKTGTCRSRGGTVTARHCSHHAQCKKVDVSEKANKNTVRIGNGELRL